MVLNLLNSLDIIMVLQQDFVNCLLADNFKEEEAVAYLHLIKLAYFINTGKVNRALAFTSKLDKPQEPQDIKASAFNYLLDLAFVMIEAMAFIVIKEYHFYF